MNNAYPFIYIYICIYIYISKELSLMSIIDIVYKCKDLSMDKCSMNRTILIYHSILQNIYKDKSFHKCCNTKYDILKSKLVYGIHP